jgi:NAD-dependent deacetylase
MINPKKLDTSSFEEKLDISISDKTDLLLDKFDLTLLKKVFNYKNDIEAFVLDLQLKQLSEYIKKATNITFLTGAGISTESGIPDFKSTDKNWKYAISRVSAMSKNYFEGKPKKFWVIYKDVFEMKMTANLEPNYGHIFLKELENSKNINIITQNVDGLHQKAGSTNVFEVHGSLKTATCPKCKKIYDLEYINKIQIPRCYCQLTTKFILKPDVVLFGDKVRHIKKIKKNVLKNTDLFIVLGSSLEVFPVNGLPLYAKLGQIPIVIINNDETKMDKDFHLVIHNSISDTFQKLKKYL